MHFLKLPPDTLFGVRENYSMSDQNLQQMNKDFSIHRLLQNCLTQFRAKQEQTDAEIALLLCNSSESSAVDGTLLILFVI